MTEKKTVVNEIEVTIKVIGGKWKPLILSYLRREGTGEGREYKTDRCPGGSATGGVFGNRTGRNAVSGT